MQNLIALGSFWGVVTVAFIVLVVYRQSLRSKESDWIPLTDDAREDRAIQAQTMIELKTRKLTIPIRALGTLSVLILLAIVGLWIFHTLYNPPTMYQ